MSAIQSTSLSSNESFPFLDLSSETTWRRFAIKVSEIHFSFFNWIFPFYRSILGDDRNQGGKPDSRSIELQRSTEKYRKTRRSSEVSFSPLIGILSSIEWVEFLALSISKWISSCSRSIVDNDRDTLVDQRWVDFTSHSPDEDFSFLDLPSTMIRKLSVSEGKWNSVLFLQN